MQAGKDEAMPREELVALIELVAREGWPLLDLSGRGICELPSEIARLTKLKTLNLRNQWYTPEARRNRLTTLPDEIGSLRNLVRLDVSQNGLTSLPESIGQLTMLRELDLYGNHLASLPQSIGRLTNLTRLDLRGHHLTSLPESVGQLTNLQTLDLSNNRLRSLPSSLAQLKRLDSIVLVGNPLNPALRSAYKAGPGQLMAYLHSLDEAEPLYEAKLLLVGEGGVGKTTLLKALVMRRGSRPQEGEPTTHGVQIDIHALVLPHPKGDGTKTKIKLNAWDFGGQEVYRITHQFFFSRRSLYLLVWEPRRGVQQCQVEDWLKLIRLRVGDDARVLIVSTHCSTGERIARIDKPVLRRDFGEMIAGFHEVDSLVTDRKTGQKVGIVELKQAIAREAAKLEQMGMEFGRRWREARDELLALPEPRISYGRFCKICTDHGLAPIDIDTLAYLMHDLGYIVRYAEDERLRDDVVLQPQWLTKAISFVLEDRTTQEMDGILPDRRLPQVWRDHSFENEPRYEPALYPFFLRLMEKYDVSYRLPTGRASLVAQHVPQVRPELPWLPEQPPPDNQRRTAMLCTMDEEPPGLVPWMIVRTHDYATQRRSSDGQMHRLHWQKGMFLSYPPHGEGLLEQRGREFHMHVQAVYPQYFMSVLQHTLHKLIVDNWPGLEGRYRFTVPCPTRLDGQPCKGRFNIDALRRFMAEGDPSYRCQECGSKLSIAELLLGFEVIRPSEELRDIQARLESLDFTNELHNIQVRLEGLDSRVANYFMMLMRAIADEAKQGPRLFTIEMIDEGSSLDPRRLVRGQYRLRLWCEAQGCQHPVSDEGVGAYVFTKPWAWVRQIAPYLGVVFSMLKTLMPVARPAIDLCFGAGTAASWRVEDQLEAMKELSKRLPEEADVRERPDPRSEIPIEEQQTELSPGILSAAERSGLLTLHALLRELDPNQERLGLTRVPTYTGDYRWLCRTHYQEWQPKIPEKIEA